jgi:hypothetical protein
MVFNMPIFAEVIDYNTEAQHGILFNREAKVG